MTAKPPTDDEVRRLLVHPAIWPDLVAWLDGRGIDVGLMPPAGDDLPTYLMTPRFPDDAALCDTCGHPGITHPEGGYCTGKLPYGETCGCDDYEPAEES